MMLAEIAGGRLLATKTNHQTSADVGMVRVTGKYAAQHLMLDPVVLQRATGRVRGGEDAIDVGPAFHSLGIKPLNHLVTYCRTAIHRGNQDDVVSCAHTTVGAVEPLKCSRQLLRWIGRCDRTEIVGNDVVVCQVVRMDVVTGLDRCGRNADGLAVLDDRFFHGDGRDGDFVSGRDVGSRRH